MFCGIIEKKGSLAILLGPSVHKYFRAHTLLISCVNTDEPTSALPTADPLIFKAVIQVHVKCLDIGLGFCRICSVLSLGDNIRQVWPDLFVHAWREV